MSKKTLLGGVLVLAFSSAALAGGAGAPMTRPSAQVQAPTSHNVIATLDEAGYKVSFDFPTFSTTTNLNVVTAGHSLNVWITDCEPDLCSHVNVSTAWNYSAHQDQPDLKLIEDWNASHYTRVHLFDSAYVLSTYMPIRGGYAKAGLKAWMADYLDDVADFEKELPQEFTLR